MAEQKKRASAGKGPAAGKGKKGKKPPVDLEKVRSLREQTARRAQEEAALSPQAGQDPPDEIITTAFVLDCLAANELGDATLYATVNRGRFLFARVTPLAGDWYVWDGNAWRHDKFRESQKAVESVALAYLRASEDSEFLMALSGGDSKSAYARCRQLQDRAKGLRKESKQRTVLAMIEVNIPEMMVDADLLDANPWLFAFANGVVDLRSGDFRPGLREDLITKSSKVEWKGLTADSGLWKKTLAEIFEGDPETVMALQRLIGYMMCGHRPDHVFAILYGAGGRNGKDMIFGLLQAIFGERATPIPSEMLVEQGKGNSRSADAPSPAILDLRGRWMVYASETDQGNRFAVGRIKWLSGGGRLIGRHLNDKRPTPFDPTHIMVLLTNELPEVPSHDEAFWERALLLEFKLRFVDEPTRPNERMRDKDRGHKLREILSGIAAWCVEGCLLYQRDGLKPSAAMRKAKSDYQSEEDLVGLFLRASCGYPHAEDPERVVVEDPGGEVLAGDLYDAFENWFTENVGKKVWSQKRFGQNLRKLPYVTAEKSGLFRYKGIALNAAGQAMADETKERRERKDRRSG